MSLNIAIIPARAGSKRLPKKNIKTLAGKPLISWTIEAALKSKLFDMVIVSTDSQEIADIALADGALVPCLRPAELAGDSATTNDVITHMVDFIESTHREVSRVTILQPTSPLRDAEDIIQAMELYDRKKALAVISVSELEYPIQYCNRLPADRCMKGFIPDNLNKRTQDLEPYFRLNGAIYIIDRIYVSNLSKIYDSRTYAYIMDKNKSIDIDNEEDFKFAQYLKISSD